MCLSSKIYRLTLQFAGDQAHPSLKMQLCYAIALAMVAGQTSAASNITWSPAPTPPMRQMQQAVTITLLNVQYSTVDVFVKRLPAKKADPDTAPNVWILQGGLGYTSALLDIPMLNLYLETDSAVNIYTMDHRGAGQGTLLKCEAGQNQTETSQVPLCAQELQEKYGDLAAFSTTSAAKDLATFISDHGNDFSTVVYGVGYGTLWVERVMHLDPPEVTGYVLDGVATTSGDPVDKFPYVSSMATSFGEVSDAVLALCPEDSECKTHFKTKGIQATIKHLYAKFDKNPHSTCAKLITTVESGQDGDPPSFRLRYVLGSLLISSTMRTLIPPIVFRLLRCSSQDVEVLKHYVSMVNTPPVEDKITSAVLTSLITYSEMWESPSPSISKLKTQFGSETASTGTSYTVVPWYCAYSKEKSPTCDKLKVGNYKGNGIVYERDEYWNKAAKIPDQASVLLMGSKMDTFTPNKNAEYLLEALVGGKKELVTFDYTTQGSLFDSTSFQPLCGLTVLASYVKGEGDLKKLNKACVDEMPAFNWTIPVAFQYMFFEHG